MDVAIVGGGITGLTAAHLLKREGLKVAVLEREGMGGVDTGHTTAHLTAVTDLRLHRLAKRFGPAAARAVWEGHGAAIDRIALTIREEEIACDFHWVPGYLHLPADAKAPASHRRDLKREEKAAAELGIRAAWRETVPLMETAGLEFPHQALFHPRKYLAALARTIPGRGSHLFAHSPVEEVLERPLAVRSGKYRVRCGRVILATHTPLTGKTPLIPALLFQTKLYLYTSYALGARLPRGSAPEASVWDTANPYSYLRVERKRDHDYAIYGGEDHKTGQVDDTRAPFRHLEARFRRLFPKARIDHRWSGQVIETNDGLPFIGETAPRQFAATGFSGNGMTYGTLSAMMAADWVANRRNPWTRLFDIHRKKVRGGTWEYVRENWDYPYYLVRDWVGGKESRSLRAVPRGGGRILHLEGRKVAAHRDETGKVSLCSPVCTHLQCIVGWNAAEGTWDCPCHGSRFKPTGEVISGPAEEPLAPVKAD